MFLALFLKKQPLVLPSPYMAAQVIDVCGGHGALALLFLAHGQAEEAMIIDQLQPSSHGWLCHLADGGFSDVDLDLIMIWENLLGKVCLWIFLGFEKGRLQ